MQVKRIKQVVIYEDVDLCITGITLLSYNEFRQAHHYIPQTGHKLWWLRDVVSEYPNLIQCGDYNAHDVPNNKSIGIRPALKIPNVYQCHLKSGDKFDFAGHVWTVVPGKLALCDDFIGYGCFRKDWRAIDSNEYEASDVKKYIENWFNQQIS